MTASTLSSPLQLGVTMLETPLETPPSSPIDAPVNLQLPLWPPMERPLVGIPFGFPWELIPPPFRGSVLAANDVVGLCAAGDVDSMGSSNLGPDRPPVL